MMSLHSVQTSGMSDRQRRTILQMQRLRPLVRRQDFYSILGVARSATHREIVTAYRHLARVVAPDRNPGMDTTAIFQAVNRAYEVLSDETERRTYDAGGHRDEYAYDEQEAEGDEAVPGDTLNAFLTAGVKPSEHFRDLFQTFLAQNVSWQTPSQSLDSWLRECIASTVADVNALLPPDRRSSDVHCSICTATICQQGDPRRSALEASHMEAHHNAYLARVQSIREALGHPSSVESVLYPEAAPFPMPVKANLTASARASDAPLRRLLRLLGDEFRASLTPSVLVAEWPGHDEWRQLVSLLRTADAAAVDSFRGALSGTGLPEAESGTPPTAEVSPPPTLSRRGSCSSRCCHCRWTCRVPSADRRRSSARTAFPPRYRPSSRCPP